MERLTQYRPLSKGPEYLSPKAPPKLEDKPKEKHKARKATKQLSQRAVSSALANKKSLEAKFFEKIELIGINGIFSQKYCQNIPDISDIFGFWNFFVDGKFDVCGGPNVGEKSLRAKRLLWGRTWYAVVCGIFFVVVKLRQPGIDMRCLNITWIVSL